MNVDSPWLGWKLGAPTPSLMVICEHGSLRIPDQSWLALALAELRDRYGEIGVTVQVDL
jgi:hypothetical protein